MNTSLVHVDSTQLLVNEIKATRRHLADLEKQLTVRLETKAASPEESHPYENDVSLIVLVIAAFSLFFVMKSGVIMKPDMSRSVMGVPVLEPQEHQAVAREPNCGRYNGDFVGCVEGQKKGNGCAWWSDCQRCYDNSLKGAEVICK